MSYRIEYLTETTEDESVCHTLLSQSEDVEGAAAEAFAKAGLAKDLFGATGFQIRHLNAVDEVVAIANFDT
jgi:hypothetical protein